MEKGITLDRYKEQIKEITEQIDALNAERVYIEKKAAEDHAEFKVGDRILTQYGGTKTDAMVTGHKIRINWNGDIEITTLSVKVKKDGSLSTIRCVDSELFTSIVTLTERGYGQRMGFIKEEPTT